MCLDNGSLEQRNITEIVLDNCFHDHLKDGLHIGGVRGGREMRADDATGIMVALEEFLLNEQCRLVNVFIGT